MLPERYASIIDVRVIRLDRPAWESRTWPHRTAVTGLRPCLTLLGLAVPGDPA